MVDEKTITTVFSKIYHISLICPRDLYYATLLSILFFLNSLNRDINHHNTDLNSFVRIVRMVRII